MTARWLFLLTLLALRPISAQQVITTVAGTDWLFPGNGQSARNAPLSGQTGLDIALDQNGNYYLADRGNEMILRVGTDGIINVIAGNGFDYSSGDGGLAVNAAIEDPTCVAVDNNGNVYLGQFDGTIRKITPDGIIHTLLVLPSHNGVEAEPLGMALDPSGNLFVSDFMNNLIDRVAPDGAVTVVAGGGSAISSGIPATSAALRGPTRIALDTAGNLYIVEFQGGVIRKVDSNGQLTTFAGGGKLHTDGISATSAALLPLAVATDPAGNVYIVDSYSQALRKIDMAGKITTVAGGSGKEGFAGDGGPATQAIFQFGVLPAIAIEPSGTILVSDASNARIRAITPDGNINTVAGNGLFHFSGNDGPAITATIDTPLGLVGDPNGNLFFSEEFSNRIRRVDKNGIISVYAGTGILGDSGDGGPATQATLAYPSYLAIAPANTPLAAPGSLVFSDSVNGLIRAIDPNGIITTIAGTNGGCTFNGDLLPALKSCLVNPAGIDFDSAGDLLIADASGNRIRAIIATGQYAGQVITLAGDGTAGYGGDTKIAPNNSQVNNPEGVRAHGTGVYFSDTYNNVVRFVDFNTGVITTVVGNGKADYAGDGGPATQASLSGPNGINFDSQGNMYIADQGNSVIRKVDTNGIISTFAGMNATFIGDGLAPNDAFIGSPVDIYIDPQDNVLFSDYYFNRIHKVVVNNPPKFQIAPATLAFTAAAGSTPQDQSINIAGSVPGIPFTASVASSGWLTLSSVSGRMPAQLRVIVNPASLSPGTYPATITITAPNSNPSAQTVSVSLTVTAPGQSSLSVNPNSFTFPFVQGAGPATRPITVSNIGGGALAFNASASGGSWLQVSPLNATLAAFGSTTLNIKADPTGLAPGTYTGSVTISSSNPAQSILVPVTMTVSALQQTILIPQTGLTFFAVAGSNGPPPQYFSILNTGVGQMPWAVTTSTTAPKQFLLTFPKNGQTDASSPLVPQVSVGVDPSGLNPGTYYGTVQVTSPGATNSPQFVSVVLTLLPPGSALPPIVQPVGLIFTGVADGESPGSQTVTVQSTNSNPTSFRSGTVTSDGGNWLTSVPLVGTVTANQPANIVIQPQTDGLKAGVYNGSLTLSFSDGSTETVSIVLVLVPGNARQSSTKLSVRDAQGACPTSTLQGVFTQLPNGFSIPAGYPGQVSVRITDNCANPMVTGGVAVTFSNGDPPVRLTSLKDGNWAGTWTPQRPASQITVTANASIPDQNLSGSFSIKGGLQTQSQPPVISPGGVVNAASFSGQALAPGSLMTVYGTALSNGQAGATTTPLPITLAGTSISLAGSPAPLMYSSTGQVNAQVPYGLAVNTAQQILASRDTSISVPQSITLAPAAPGIFGIAGSTQGIIVDQNANIIDSQHPAKAGDAIVIYATGLGEVTPAATAGMPASLTQLSTTVLPVSATIGGVSANVLFSGLTPGFIGLYQVNVVVPSGVAAGDQVPVVITAGGISSPPVTISLR